MKYQISTYLPRAVHLGAIALALTLLYTTAQAEVLSTSHNGKALFCTKNTRGKIDSGKQTKRGKFKSDRKQFKKAKKNRKLAKKLRNKRALKRWTKKINFYKSRKQTCIDLFNGNGGGDNPGGGTGNGGGNNGSGNGGPGSGGGGNNPRIPTPLPTLLLRKLS